MGLLFADQTQIRLNQNSMMQVKQTGEGKERSTTINLPAGRSWIQSKQVPDRLFMETPSAVAAIRGTEWEMAVDDEGRSTLTVLTGEVEFYNDFGRVIVAASEQAVAEKGRAPVKRIIQNPRERVQWVSAFVVEPARYAELRDETALGQDAEGRRLLRIIEAVREQRLKVARDELEAMVAAPAVKRAAAFLLLADFHIYGGEFAQALRTIDAGGARFPDDERFDAAAARLHLYSDDAAQARARLQSAFAKNPQSMDASIIAGELAKFEGDAKGAVASFGAATRYVPEDARGWYGLGAVETEREDVSKARGFLSRAIALDPKGPGYRGELGTLETFANNLAEARRQYAQALEDAPDDYVALTGLGVLELKAGDAEKALENLLKAGAIEPRYARVHLYVAVAYYQQGRVDAALGEIARATELDPKDPFPHILASLIHTDLIRPGAALASAAEARRLMPYLRSLNQIANNQKGSANLGSALALFGLEEWARSYAQQSYYPWWAGSHLFLADRYPGDYAKNSELFQGFISDPTVFGASNRFQSLTPRPGNYAAANLLGAWNRNLSSSEASLTLNGYANESSPVAYFANVGRARISPGDTKLTADADSITAAFGAKPDAELGLFGFAKYFSADMRLDGNPIGGKSGRVDLGAQRQFSPTSQLWFKVGIGNDESTFRTPSDALRFRQAPTQDDVQLRHVFAYRDGHELSWGLERGAIRDMTTLSAGTLDFREGARSRSLDGYASGRWRLTERLLVQTDLWLQRFDRDGRTNIRVDDPGVAPIVIDDHFNQLRRDANPRLGAVYQFEPGRLVRVAWQKWFRPASVATLGPVATAGIPIEDPLVQVGGKLDRLRAQVEWELTSRSFVAAYLDRQEIRNLPAAGLAAGVRPDLAELDNLRNRSLFNVASLDGLEGRPEFGQGRVRAAGAAWNQVFGAHWSGYLRYAYADSENIASALQGRQLPFLPKERYAAGVTWVGNNRMYLSAQLLHRSARFADEANLRPMRGGWEGIGNLYWETDDKRWALQGAVNGLLKKDTPVTIVFNASYRF
jgi:tetratricopeptide (TPR) repeat protein